MLKTLLVISLFLVVISCATSRKITVDSEMKSDVILSDAFTNDSIFEEIRTSVSELDTIESTVSESGMMKIVRDSIGNINCIMWTSRINNKLISAMSHADMSVSLANVSSKSISESTHTSQTINSHDTKKRSMSLEGIIGTSLLGVVIIYLLFIFFKDILWEKFLKR